MYCDQPGVKQLVISDNGRRMDLNKYYIYISKCKGPTEDSCLQMQYVAGNKGNKNRNCANRKHVWRFDGTVQNCSSPTALSFNTRI